MLNTDWDFDIISFYRKTVLKNMFVRSGRNNRTIE